MQLPKGLPYQTLVDETSPDNDITLSSGSLCTDINSERINCDLHLLNTLPKSDDDFDDTGSDSDSNFEDIYDVSDEEDTDIEQQHPSLLSVFHKSSIFFANLFIVWIL